MAEKFNDILKELNKNPLNEKIEKVIDIIYNMADIFARIIEENDKKIKNLEMEILKLHLLIKVLEKQKIINKEKLHLPLSEIPLSNVSATVKKEPSMKSMIMGELRELFKKKEKLENIKNKRL